MNFCVGFADDKSSLRGDVTSGGDPTTLPVIEDAVDEVAVVAVDFAADVPFFAEDDGECSFRVARQF